MMKMLRTLSAFALLLSAASLSFGQCKIERTYDRFTDRTRAVCVVVKTKDIDLSIIARHEGEAGTRGLNYLLSFYRFDTRSEIARYKNIDRLYLLAGDFRTELPLTEYKSSPGMGMINERADFEISRADLMKIIEADGSEARFGTTEFMFTVEARKLLRSFVEQIEGVRL